MSLVTGDEDSKQGTAFCEFNDDWDRQQLEWVVQQPHVYAILYCFFAQSPEPNYAKDVHAETRTVAVDAHTGMLILSQCGGACEPSPRRADEELDPNTLFVRRDSVSGRLVACEFCSYHVDRGPGKQLCCAFTKIQGQHVISLPRMHVAGLASRAFWKDMGTQERLALLWQLRDEAFCKAISAENGGRALAEPVMQGGVWVYDPSLLSAGDILLVFHTQVRLCVLVCASGSYVHQCMSDLWESSHVHCSLVSHAVFASSLTFVQHECHPLRCCSLEG
jgi:hypothetical protein